VERGVPKDKIVRVAHEADNTRMEAQALAQVATAAQMAQLDRGNLEHHTPACPLHLRTRIFRPESIIRVTGARDGDFDPSSWWERRISVKELYASWPPWSWPLGGSWPRRCACQIARYGGAKRGESSSNGVARQGTPNILPYSIVPLQHRLSAVLSSRFQGRDFPTSRRRATFVE